jgi:hypothetical protein
MLVVAAVELLGLLAVRLALEELVAVVMVLRQYLQRVLLEQQIQAVARVVGQTQVLAVLAVQA